MQPGSVTGNVNANAPGGGGRPDEEGAMGCAGRRSREGEGEGGSRVAMRRRVDAAGAMAGRWQLCCGRGARVR
jgi:hypothetical protein